MLTNEIGASQSEEPSEKGKELKLCVNHHELQVPVKSILQVLRTALQIKKKKTCNICYDSTCVLFVYMQRCCAADQLSSCAVCGQKWSEVPLHDSPTELRSILQHPGRTTSSFTVEKNQSTFTQDQVTTPREDGKSHEKNVSNLKVIGLNWHCVSFVAIHGENLQCTNLHQYSKKPPKKVFHLELPSRWQQSHKFRVKLFFPLHYYSAGNYCSELEMRFSCSFILN